MNYRKALATIVLVLAGAALLMFLTIGFMEAYIWFSGALGLHHALGVDSQSTQNYAFSSGPGPLMVTSIGFSGFGVAAWRHFNCEEVGCWRPGHRHPDHGRPVCRVHYHSDVVPPAP